MSTSEETRDQETEEQRSEGGESGEGGAPDPAEHIGGVDVEGEDPSAYASDFTKGHSAGPAVGEYEGQNQWRDAGIEEDMIPPDDYDKTEDPIWPGNTRIDNPAISVRDLSKSFGSNHVLEDINVDFPKGQITVILGPSGTGKSVFLRHLLGLLKPDKGEIWIGDRNMVDLGRRDMYEVRRKMGVLFQDGALFGSMSIYENTAFPLREHTNLGESEIDDIVSEKLAAVGLEGAHDKLPGEVSGGMRKRAGLARGLVLNPEIILFDEPDSGLDPVRTTILNDLILELSEDLGSTMLIVTHDIRTAKRIGDYVGLLFRRNLVAFGTNEDMFDSPYPVVRQFLSGDASGPIGMSNERDRPELL